MIPYKDLVSSKFTAESGVPNGKKTNAIGSRVSTRGQKTFNLYRNGMFSYMVGIE